MTRGRIARRLKGCSLLAILEVMVIAFPSGNATAQDRPAAVDSRQIEKQILSRELERARVERSLPRTPTVQHAPRIASSVPSFVLRAISVEGAQAFNDDELRESYANYLGKAVSQADLENIAVTISDKYRSAGFHLSRALIPPQDVHDGAIRIRVIEGAIAEITVVGDLANRFGVRSALSDIQNERPSRLSSLERKLLIVSDIPGLKVVDTGIEEITEASGDFRLTVKVDTWNIYLSLGIDNSGTKAVGPLQSYGSVTFNSYLFAGDALSLNASTVPDSTRDLRDGRIAYDSPIGRDGFKLGATASYSEVWPDDDRRAVNTHIDNQTYALRGSYAPVQTRALTLNLFSAFSYTDETEKNDFGLVYKDRIRTLRLGADIRALDPFSGANYATLSLRRGLDVANATQMNDPLSSQWDAGPNFSILEYSYTRYQQFTENFSAKGAVSGQYSFNPLFSSQKFYLGSAAFGSGYYSGDNGVSGLFEVRFDKSFSSEWLNHLQLYAFIDGGAAWDGGFSKRGIASFGPGLRVNLFDTLNAGVAYALPVAQTTKTDEYKTSRFLFTLATSLKFCPDRAQMQCLKQNEN